MHVQEYIRESSSPDRKARFNKPVEGEELSSSQFETRNSPCPFFHPPLSSSFSNNRVSSLLLSSPFFHQCLGTVHKSAILLSVPPRCFTPFASTSVQLFTRVLAPVFLSGSLLYIVITIFILPPPLTPPLHSSHRNSLKSREYSRVTRGTFLPPRTLLSSLIPFVGRGREKFWEEERRGRRKKEKRDRVTFSSGKISSAAWSSRQSNLLLASYLGSRCNARSQLLLIA